MLGTAIAVGGFLLDNRSTGGRALEADMLDKPSQDTQPALPKRLLELLGYQDKSEGQKKPGTTF